MFLPGGGRLQTRRGTGGQSHGHATQHGPCLGAGSGHVRQTAAAHHALAAAAGAGTGQRAEPRSAGLQHRARRRAARVPAAGQHPAREFRGPAAPVVEDESAEKIGRMDQAAPTQLHGAVRVGQRAGRAWALARPRMHSHPARFAGRCWTSAAPNRCAHHVAGRSGCFCTAKMRRYRALVLAGRGRIDLWPAPVLEQYACPVGMGLATGQCSGIGGAAVATAAAGARCAGAGASAVGQPAGVCRPPCAVCGLAAAPMWSAGAARWDGRCTAGRAAGCAAIARRRVSCRPGAAGAAPCPAAKLSAGGAGPQRLAAVRAAAGADVAPVGTCIAPPAWADAGTAGV